MTEPVKVTAPMNAPSANSMRVPPGMGVPLLTIPKAQGSDTADTAISTAAKPIMLCMKATSSGILVISTRLAIKVPAAPPITKPTNTQAMPAMPLWPASAASLRIKATVVSTAMAMPAMPKALPRIDVVGCDRPLSAWMKKTLATKYSSVTRLKLMVTAPPLSWPDALSS